VRNQILVTRSDSSLQAGMQVSLKNFLFYPQERCTNSPELGQDVDAIALGLDHSDHPINLPTSAIEAWQLLGMAWM
jgi:hypothetical protein